MAEKTPEEIALELIKKTLTLSETKLDLSGCELETLPSEIGSLTHLKWLNLSNNKIQKLPVEIKHLKDLQTLLLLIFEK